jgi:hypothetical protein
MDLRTLSFDGLRSILRFVDLDSLARLYATFDSRIQFLVSSPRVINYLDFPKVSKVPRSHIKYLLKSLKTIGQLIIPKDVSWSIFSLHLLSSLAPSSIVLHTGFLHVSTRQMWKERAKNASNPQIVAALSNLSSDCCSLLLNRILPTLESLTLEGDPCKLIDEVSGPKSPERDHSGVDSVEIASFLSSLPPTLTSLKCLSFNVPRGAVKTNWWESIIHSLPPTLTKLKIDALHGYRALVPLASIFNHLPQIESLSITCYYHKSFKISLPEDGIFPTIPSSLTSLQLGLLEANLEIIGTNKVFTEAKLFQEEMNRCVGLLKLFSQMTHLRELSMISWYIPDGTDLNEHLSTTLTRLELLETYMNKNCKILLPKSIQHLSVNPWSQCDPARFGPIIQQLPALNSLKTIMVNDYAPYWMPWLTELDVGDSFLPYIHSDKLALLPRGLKLFSCSQATISDLYDIMKRLPDQCRIKIRRGMDISDAGAFLIGDDDDDDAFNSSLIPHLDYIDGLKTLVASLNQILDNRVIGTIVCGVLQYTNGRPWSTKSYRHFGDEQLAQSNIRLSPHLEVVPMKLVGQLMPNLESIDIELMTNLAIDLKSLPSCLTSLNLNYSTINGPLCDLPKTLTILRVKRPIIKLLNEPSESKQFLIFDAPNSTIDHDIIFGWCHPEMREFNAILLIRPIKRSKVESEISTFANHHKFRLQLVESK